MQGYPSTNQISPHDRTTFLVVLPGLLQGYLYHDIVKIELMLTTFLVLILKNLILVILKLEGIYLGMSRCPSFHQSFLALSRNSMISAKAIPLFHHDCWVPWTYHMVEESHWVVLHCDKTPL